MNNTMLSVLREVQLERQFQDDKWGAENHSLECMLAVLMEEVGEVAKCLNEYTPVREELVQVAAVAVCWLQMLPLDT